MDDTPPLPSPPTVLSLQSHVAFGRVGNRAAVFPLERLGIETVVINTVQFSNHTGYGVWTGAVTPPDLLLHLLDGIEQRGALVGLAALLTGYLGDAGTVAVAAEARRRSLRHSPGAVHVCDPVMGDEGRGFFVKPGLPELIRDELAPGATLLTPNPFELGFLAGVDRLAAAPLPALLAASRTVRARGTRAVLVTSVEGEAVGAERLGLLYDGPEGAYLATTPRLALPTPPNGAGDATAALFLAHWLQGGRDPALALARTAESIFSVFEVTHALRTRELALIAAGDRLAAPNPRFTAKKLR